MSREWRDVEAAAKRRLPELKEACATVLRDLDEAARAGEQNSEFWKLAQPDLAEL